MQTNRIHVIFMIHSRGQSVDLDIPTDISATELVVSLNSAYALNIDVSDMKKCYLKTENPFALLRGNKTLRDYGLQNGTIINYTE